MSSYGYKSSVLMIFNQLASYVEDVLKSYILKEILIVATSINFYSLCLQCSTSQSGTSSAESVVCHSSNFQRTSPPALEFKRTLKRPLTIDSDSDKLDSPVKSSRARRTKWNHEDNQNINQYFEGYVTPNGKKCSPTSDEIEQFLSKYSCSKTFGSSVSFSRAKKLICSKIHNNRRLLCETRKSSTSFKR